SPDALIVYTIDWSVDGNEATDNLVIEDNTPDNSTFFNAEGAVTIDDPGVGNSGLVRWRLGAQLPGASGTVTLTVRADTPLDNGSIIENEATISDDNDGATDSDTVLTTVGSSHGFVLDKDDHVQTTIAPDQVINYTIHWQVTGNEAAQNVAITDSIPLNTSFESCGACVLQGDHVRWNLGSHNPSDEGDVFLQVRVDTPLPDASVITNTAYIFDDNDGLAEEDTTHTTVSSDHELVLDKQAPSAVAAGDEIGYTIDWSITGDEPAFGVVLTDTVPVNTTLVSIADGGVETPPGSGLIVWNLGDQEPGDTGAVHFNVQTISPLPDGTDIVNTAHASDDDGKTGEDSAITEVTSGHGFDITKSDSVDPVDAGAPLEYTIEWSVTGNEPAEDVIVQDTLPDDVTFVSATPGGVETPPGSGIIVWNLAGPYAPGEGETLTITVDVASPLANNTQLLNAVTIEDANGGMPGSDTETTLVHSDHALQVSKIGLPSPVSAGGQITYSISYTITGNEPAPGVRVEDVVPEHTAFAWATPGYSLIGTLVRWDLGDLDPGDDGTLVLVVTVDSPLPSDTTIYNSVFIEDEDDES
ncbi:MAG: DUF11 domain-containing protein, partial [Actinomycetia bacterium]|nr:DUF11 domain-containing protein [Actinomycetes bacterium]